MWKFSRRIRSNASRWRVGRVAGLGAGDVEPDDALVALRTAHAATSTERAAWRIAVTSIFIDDRLAGRGGPLHPDPEALEVRLDDLVEGQPALGRELGGVADLGVRDAVGGEVLGALGGDADDRVAFLEDADGVGERLEVELERLAVGAAPEPRRELVDVGRRQRRRSRTRGRGR